jgi:hypothetical protein
LVAALLTATPAAATQAVQATQQSVQLTDTAFNRQLTADAATSAAQGTATQQRAVELERTQIAAQAQTQVVAQTATAWPPLATQTQAALNEVARREQQRNVEAFWQQATAWFWPIFWIGLALVGALLLILGLIFAYRRLLPTFDLWLRTRRGANGETEIAVPDSNGNIHFVLPGKSAAPVLTINPAGVAHAEGLANPALQQQALTQEALLRMLTVVAANPQAARVVWQTALANAANAMTTSAAPAQTLAAQPTAVTAEVVEVVPLRQAQDQGDVAVWLDEVEVKLLTNGGPQ